jgi:hypothetical protein
MPDIARLDERGVLVAVETVSALDHLTDPRARTVALPAGHDMAQRLGGYRYDFIAGCFLPVSTEPLDTAERETPGLVEGLVEFVEALERELDFPLPAKTKAAITAWRRSFDGRRR